MAISQKIISLAIIAFGLLLLFVAVIRLLRRSQEGLKVRARIINVSEGTEDVLMKYSILHYYYPIISYEYDVGPEKYRGDIGKRQARMFRIPELAPMGGKTSEDKFFWRKLAPGDPIDVIFSSKNPWRSIPTFSETETYKSETTALFFSSVILLSIGAAFLFSIP